MKIRAFLSSYLASRAPVGRGRRPVIAATPRTLASLAALALAGTFATAPLLAFELDIHERITRNALPFLNEDVLQTIVDGNEDEDEGDAYEDTRRHGQNCRFRDSAGYANQRYGEIVDALINPPASDPNRAARLFGHITHGIQDFYSHSNWIPAPPQGLGIRNRILDDGLGFWTEITPYTNIFDDIVTIEGNPPDGMTAVLPRDAEGRATSGVPIVTDRRIFVVREGAVGVRDVTVRRIARDPRVRTYRGLMTSVSGDEEDIDETTQFCPPIGSDCAIAVPPGRPPEAMCLRHGSKRSNGSAEKTFSIESTRSYIPPFRKTTREGRMNLDGDGGTSGDWFEARHYAKLQTQHEWCRLLHVSRINDPSFGATALLLGTWVGTDAGAVTPHIASTACARGAAKHTRVEVSATPAEQANFIVFRGDFTSSARTTIAAGKTGTLSICGNPGETIVAALNRWNTKGPIDIIQVPAEARAWTATDHRGAFRGTFSIKVTPNAC